MSQDDAVLVRDFQEAWWRVAAGSNDRADAVMSALLAATGARAVGWWRQVGEQLEQLSFQAVADMPEEVRVGFLAATGRVAMPRPSRASASARPAKGGTGTGAGGVTTSAWRHVRCTGTATGT